MVKLGVKKFKRRTIWDGGSSITELFSVFLTGNQPTPLIGLFLPLPTPAGRPTRPKTPARSILRSCLLRFPTPASGGGRRPGTAQVRRRLLRRGRGSWQGAHRRPSHVPAAVPRRPRSAIRNESSGNGEHRYYPRSL